MASARARARKPRILPLVAALLVGLLPGKLIVCTATGQVPTAARESAPVLLSGRVSAPPGPPIPPAPPRRETASPPHRPVPPVPAGGATDDRSIAPRVPNPAPPDDGDAPPTPPVGAGAVAPGARYSWPLLPPAVLTYFDEPLHPYGRGHRGVDLAGSPGQAVLAAQEGTVGYAGPLAGRGVVSVQHPDGLRTTYEPVTPAVAVGAVVGRGAVLGALEAEHPGCPGACLHWGVRRDRLDYLDPLVLLRPPYVRLLPVPDPWPL